jgi:hypothetical protein
MFIPGMPGPVCTDVPPPRLSVVVTGPNEAPAARAARKSATSSSPKAHSFTGGLTAAPDHPIYATRDFRDGNMVRALREDRA